MLLGEPFNAARVLRDLFVFGISVMNLNDVSVTVYFAVHWGEKGFLSSQFLLMAGKHQLFTGINAYERYVYDP